MVKAHGTVRQNTEGTSHKGREGCICNSPAGKICCSKRLEATDGGSLKKPTKDCGKPEHFTHNLKFYEGRALDISKKNHNFDININSIPHPIENSDCARGNGRPCLDVVSVDDIGNNERNKIAMRIQLHINKTDPFGPPP